MKQLIRYGSVLEKLKEIKKIKRSFFLILK